MSNMFRIITVDDDTAFLKDVNARLREVFEKSDLDVHIDTFSDSRNAEKYALNARPCDIWLLDIEMPAPDGFDLAKTIRKTDQDAILIFVSVHENLVLRSFRYHPYFFLSKLRLKRDFPIMMEEIISILRQREPKYYLIQEKTRVKRLSLQDIVFIEKSGKYVSFHCASQSVESERTSLGDVLHRLPSDRFIRASRSRIINLEHFSRFEGNVLIMSDRTKIRVSGAALPEVRLKIHKYFERIKR